MQVQIWFEELLKLGRNGGEASTFQEVKWIWYVLRERTVLFLCILFGNVIWWY